VEQYISGRGHDRIELSNGAPMLADDVELRQTYCLHNEIPVHVKITCHLYLLLFIFINIILMISQNKWLREQSCYHLTIKRQPSSIFYSFLCMRYLQT